MMSMTTMQLFHKFLNSHFLSDQFLNVKRLKSRFSNDICAHRSWLFRGLVCLLCSQCSFVFAANTIKRIELTHRDAVEIQSIIAPLLNKDSGITIDNNSVMISSSSSVVNQLTKIIKRMDVPQQRLQIAVYRGQYPKDHAVDQQGVITHTTDAGINELQRIKTEEGRTVSITKNSVVNINTVDEGYYERYMDLDRADRHLLKQTGTNNPVQGEALARKAQSEIQVLPTGIYIRSSLVGKQKVRIDIKTIMAANHTSQFRHQEQAAHKAQIIDLSHETNAVVTARLDQWVQVSAHTQFSHRPALGNHRKVYSTKTATDQQLAVWVKVSLLRNR